MILEMYREIGIVGINACFIIIDRPHILTVRIFSHLKFPVEIGFLKFF